MPQIAANKTGTQATAGDHAEHHNALANAINQLDGSWENVRKHGAVGDGTADDLAAINAAMAAAPTDGVIYFPVGDYAISAPIQPPEGKGLKFISPINTARYDSQVLPQGLPRIRLRAGFTGTAMFDMPADCRRMGIRGLNLAGNNLGTNVDGIKFKGFGVAFGEHGTIIEWCNINGFTGNGISGRLWLNRILNNSIMRNAGWGAYFNEGVTDCWFANNIWAFNRLGGVFYGPAQHNGHIYHIADRFERSGDTPAAPNSPVATDSPGFRCERAIDLHLQGCQTDGNTGDGLLFIGTTNALYPRDVSIIGGSFTRDATGARTGTNPANRAAIRIESFGATDPNRIGYIRIMGVSCIYGNPDDGGGGVASGPTNGLILKNTNFIEVFGGRFFTTGDPIVRAANEWKPSINISSLDLMTAPTDAAGAAYFPVGAIRTSGAALETWDGSAWLPAVTQSVRPPVRVAPPVNVNIAAPGATLDGITMAAGNRVLLANQTAPAQNGVYIWNGAATAMTRATDASNETLLAATLLTSVEEGTINRDAIFMLTSNKPITVGTTPLRFTRVHPAPINSSQPANLYFAPTGAKLENIPRSVAGFSGQALLASGTVRAFPLGFLRSGESLASLNFLVSTAAATVTNSWAGIARASDRAILAISPTSAVAPAVNTVKTFTFNSAFTADKDELLLGFVMFQATTVPQFYGVNHGNAIVMSNSPIYSGTSNTGTTTPLAVGATLNALTAATHIPYCYAT